MDEPEQLGSLNISTCRSTSVVFKGAFGTHGALRTTGVRNTRRHCEVGRCLQMGSADCRLLRCNQSLKRSNGDGSMGSTRSCIKGKGEEL
ncbi:unnamed protein product [Victoria cruziana]